MNHSFTDFMLFTVNPVSKEHINSTLQECCKFVKSYSKKGKNLHKEGSLQRDTDAHLNSVSCVAHKGHKTNTDTNKSSTTKSPYKSFSKLQEVNELEKGDIYDSKLRSKY